MLHIDILLFEKPEQLQISGGKAGSNIDMLLAVAVQVVIIDEFRNAEKIESDRVIRTEHHARTAVNIISNRY